MHQESMLKYDLFYTPLKDNVIRHHNKTEKMTSDILRFCSINLVIQLLVKIMSLYTSSHFAMLLKDDELVQEQNFSSL
jgi:hypothetical protein